MELDVLDGLAQEPLDGRLEAEHLLAERLQVRDRVGLEPRPDVRVLDQHHDALGERVRRRLGAADEDVGEHLGVQLVVGQRAAPLGHLGVHERAQQRVVGLGAELVEELLEVVLPLDLHLDRPAHLLVGLHQPHPLDPGVRPDLDLREVLVGHADLAADHVERQRDRELRDPLAPPCADEVVDEPVGDLLDVAVDLADRRRLERRVEELPHLEVVRVVARVEARRRHPALLLVQLLDVRGLARDLGLPLRLLRVVGTDRLARVVRAVPDPVREPLRVEEDHPDVLVAADHVHPGRVVLPDRRLVAQVRVGVVRAVVHLGVEEVELHGRRRRHVGVLLGRGTAGGSL